MSRNEHFIPSWLRSIISLSLVSEVYPELRGVAVSYREKKLTVYFYLYREPTEFDYESVNIIMDQISDNSGFYYEDDGTISFDIEEYFDKCIYDESPVQNLDELDGFVYLCREYNMEDNPK